MYYIGNIHRIKAFKQIYNANMTYEDIAKTYNIYDEIMNDEKYKKSKFQSNMFIYKKNPIPFSKYTKREIMDYNDSYHKAYILNYVCCILLYLNVFLFFLFVLMPKKIYSYIGLTLLDGVLIVFFCLSVKALSNNEVLNENINSFEDKDFHRVQLLI